MQRGGGHGRKNDYIALDVLDTMVMSFLPKALGDVLEAMENPKHHAAASGKTDVRYAMSLNLDSTNDGRLAQNLYLSSAKLVFDLLQNYDDNHYINSAHSPPSVAFSVYPDGILASCNEDGFTAATVRAIYSVRQSSKKSTDYT